MTDTNSYLSIPERVAAGAAWLDENRPGWVDRINLETLDLGNPCRCVLGQEYGEYCYAPSTARWSYAPEGDRWIASELGFDGSTTEGIWYPDLTAEWRRYILDRRGGATPWRQLDDVAKCPSCGKQSRSYSRGCSQCGFGRPS